VGHHSVWEIVFLMLVLKIPIVYLGFVVYYAIKAEPRPQQGAAVTARIGPEGGSGPRLRRQPRRFRPGPHGGPARTYHRAPRVAHAYARSRRP